MLQTLIFTFVVLLVVILVLIKVRPPYYRLERENVIALLSLVCSGEATVSDWSVFTAMPIRHDEYLDNIRLRCIEIEEREYTGDAHPPFLFSPRGIAEIEAILKELQANQPPRR